MFFSLPIFISFVVRPYHPPAKIEEISTHFFKTNYKHNEFSKKIHYLNKKPHLPSILHRYLPGIFDIYHLKKDLYRRSLSMRTDSRDK